MLFGFLLVRTLIILVKGFGRLPRTVFRVIPATMNAAARPFHVLNYLSPSRQQDAPRPTMSSLMDRTIDKLRASLARESDHTLALAMHFPTSWDPYFKEIMTVADVYDCTDRYTTTTDVRLTARRALEV